MWYSMIWGGGVRTCDMGLVWYDMRWYSMHNVQYDTGLVWSGLLTLGDGWQQRRRPMVDDGTASCKAAKSHCAQCYASDCHAVVQKMRYFMVQNGMVLWESS